MQENGRLSVFERTFNRCMGLWGDAQTLYISTLYQLWRFENALEVVQTHDGYDRLYVPRMAWTTGDLDEHDVVVDGSGRVIFVNTLFSCLATVSERYSFVPLWQPPFVTRLAAEDRCHLNGLALDDRLRERNIGARCQLQVIDLKRGDVVHSLRIEGVVSELYDVVALAGVRCPTALGFKTDEIRRVISVGAAP